MIANIRELRASTKAILQAVDRGDTVTITKRGKPYAKLTSIHRKKVKSSKTNPLFGIWKNNPTFKKQSPQKYIHELREGRHAR